MPMFNKSPGQVTFADVAHKLGFCGGVGACCGCIWFTVLIGLFFPATVHQLGQKRLGLARNTWSGVVDLDNVYRPGRYWLGFWTEFVEFPSTLNTIEFSDSPVEEGVQKLSVLKTRDRDGKRISLDISCQYLLNRDELGSLYSKFLHLYEDVFISALRDSLAQAGNQFAISESWEDNQKVTGILREACEATLASRHASCWDLQLWRVRLEGRYEAALIRTQVRKQAMRTEEARRSHSEVRAKTQVVLAEYRKNATIIKSEGEAQKYELERAARVAADKAIVEARAEILQISLDEVAITGSTPKSMTGTQLVMYNELTMLTNQAEAHFLYSMEGDGIEARNAYAAKQISASDRRLAGDTPVKLSKPLEL